MDGVNLKEWINEWGGLLALGAAALGLFTFVVWTAFKPLGLLAVLAYLLLILVGAGLEYYYDQWKSEVEHTRSGYPNEAVAGSHFAVHVLSFLVAGWMLYLHQDGGGRYSSGGDAEFYVCVFLAFARHVISGEVARHLDR